MSVLSYKEGGTLNQATYDFLVSMTKKYLYHSFHFIDYDVVKDYEIIQKEENIILVKGFHHAQKCDHIHYFTSDVESLIVALKPYQNTLIEFVPNTWVDTLIKEGFAVEAVLRDYWIKGLKHLAIEHDLAASTIENITQITNLTQSRKGASRAFQGEDESFVKDWTLNQVEEIDDTTIFIQKMEKNIVGAIFVGLYNSPEKRTLWVRELVVDEAYQGQGIGRMLLKRGLSYGHQKGAVRAFLMADDLNLNAIHLYKKMGFEPDLDSEQINMMTKKA